MSSAKLAKPSQPIIYPETDGEPMAENTIQYNAITTVKGNLEIQFSDEPLTFVAADLFWYPQEGNNKLRMAPDTLVAFGVPKGDRGSYLQWKENNIAPQVVFEILSPGNRVSEMTRKFAFYNEWGVEEYYIFDPDDGSWDGWTRQAGCLRPVPQMHGWISPRLGIRFESGESTELRLFRADGQQFFTMQQLETLRVEAEERSELDLLAREQAQLRADQAQQRADQEQQRADQEQQRADQEQQRADQEQQRADQAQRRAEQEQQRAEQEQQRAEQERQRAERAELRAAQLQDKLRAAGINLVDE